MAVREDDIQSGFATLFRALATYADADVTINDWGVLDNSNAGAPFIIIETADQFESRSDSQTPVTDWTIIVWLIASFSDWDTSLNAFQANRQEIIDTLNAGNAGSAGGLESVYVSRIAGGEKQYIYDRYGDPQHDPEALPQYIAQRLAVDVQEF